MAKYRICRGLAVMPDRDMALLKDMSAQGWHLSGVTGALMYRFEQGQPHDYDYAVDFQRDFTPEAQEIFRLSGWQPVVCSPGWQILRAEAGATPLYTSSDSQVVTLSENRANMGWSSLAFFILAAAFFALETWFSQQNHELGSLVSFTFFAVLFAAFIFAFIPFVGYSFSLRKIRAES